MITFNSPQVNQWGSLVRKKPVANTGISAGFAGESRRYRLEAEGCFVDGKHAAPQPGVGVAFQPVFRHPGDEVDPSRDADSIATQSRLKPKTYLPFAGGYECRAGFPKFILSPPVGLPACLASPCEVFGVLPKQVTFHSRSRSAIRPGGESRTCCRLSTTTISMRRKRHRSRMAQRQAHVIAVPIIAQSCECNHVYRFSSISWLATSM